MFVLVSEMSVLPCLGTSLSVCVVCIYQLLIKCSLCFQSMAVETCGHDVLHVFVKMCVRMWFTSHSVAVTWL